MFYTCVVRFDLTKNLKKFIKFFRSNKPCLVHPKNHIFFLRFHAISNLTTHA